MNGNKIDLVEYNISYYIHSMSLKQRFQETFPTAFFLENEVTIVNDYLLKQGWLNENETLISLEKPGEGNMNFVLRATTNQRSFILKQARPWVEKFPQIDAPIERVAVEAQFFQTLESVKAINHYAPKCLGFDADNFILATEDLGKGTDYSFLYQKDHFLEESEVDDLINYLSALHQAKVPTDFPDNLAMRKLNHEHIFNFPFVVDNGFNLDEVQDGLQALSMTYKTDADLKNIITDCGNIYLSKGNHLLHGDFYPGSWLKVENGLKIIDPEFGFVGPVEFDLGVLIAHLVMAEQPSKINQQVLQKYQETNSVDNNLLAKLTGIEILRRLIGIAQLPLSLDLATKKNMMDRAVTWIKSGDLIL